MALCHAEAPCKGRSFPCMVKDTNKDWAKIRILWVYTQSLRWQTMIIWMESWAGCSVQMPAFHLAHLAFCRSFTSPSVSELVQSCVLLQFRRRAFAMALSDCCGTSEQAWSPQSGVQSIAWTDRRGQVQVSCGEELALSLSVPSNAYACKDQTFVRKQIHFNALSSEKSCTLTQAPQHCILPLPLSASKLLQVRLCMRTLALPCNAELAF